MPVPVYLLQLPEHDAGTKRRPPVKQLLISGIVVQAAHEQRPGSAPELNQFGTLFDDEESWAGLMMAQVELQGADFLLPESFGLPGDSLALPVAPAQEPAKPQTASIYNIQANCSTEVQLLSATSALLRQALSNTGEHTLALTKALRSHMLQPAVLHILGGNIGPFT